MQEIVGKYPEDGLSPYLLPVLKYPFKDTHKHYRSVRSGITRNLKEIARLADISVPLSMYCARHSWASAAKGKNIPGQVSLKVKTYPYPSSVKEWDMTPRRPHKFIWLHWTTP